MTALCGGGPSGPKPNQPVQSFLTGASIEQILVTVFGLSETWASIIVFAAAQSVDWTVLCATDPPPMPTLTGTEVLDILATPWDLSQPAFQKVQSLILIGLWYYGCQCTTTVNPTPPSWPTYPTGAPTVNPPTPAGGLGDCLSLNNTTTFHDVGSSNWNDLSTIFFSPTTAVTVTGGGFGRGNLGYTIPPTATKLHIYTETLTNPNNTVNSGQLLIEYFNAAGVSTGTRGMISGGSRTLTSIDVAIPANSISAQIYFQGAATNTSPVTISVVAGFVCPNSTTPLQPCCPPDPALQGYLQQILNFVTSIYASLPTPLSSLAESAVHSGLSGSGHFVTATGTIGCKVDFSPSNAQGELAGDPLTVFNAGWITTSAVEGNYKTRRLEHSPELILFDPLVDTIHYTLSGGVTAVITEITRGP